MPLSTSVCLVALPELAPASEWGGQSPEPASRRLCRPRRSSVHHVAPALGREPRSGQRMHTRGRVTSTRAAACAEPAGQVPAQDTPPAQARPAGRRRGVESAAHEQCWVRRFHVTFDLMYFNSASSGPFCFLIITLAWQSKCSKVNCPFLLRFALNYYFFEINTCHPFLFVALDGCLLFIYVFLLKALVLATTLLF